VRAGWMIAHMHKTRLGTFEIHSGDALLARAAEIATEAARGRSRFSFALSGGSTPKAFYSYCVRTGALAPQVVASAVWSVSDERCVPQADGESNFGNAARMLLDPLGVAQSARAPWPVQLPAHEAAEVFSSDWLARFPDGSAFDLCFAGMGDDTHTLSLFPGSPLIAAEGLGSFAAVEVPGKGLRLTLTPAGLECCGRIVVLAAGASKAAALHAALHGTQDVSTHPVQLYARVADKVTWLIDPAAAAGLT
jgi:6-phosphogluconolactonase